MSAVEVVRSTGPVQPAAPERTEPPGRPGRPGRHERDVPVPDWFDMSPYMSAVGSVLASQANVIMQLSRPEVGYGVANSRVHSGSAMRHPVKRGRTTFTYIAVALLGTQDDRTAYRRAVNGQHAQVVNQPDEPVAYRAMDPELQTWVAACLYYGTRDIVAAMHGPLSPAEADALYAQCARLGTTLQMPASAWPEDRAAFDRYWERSLERVRIDPPVRDYLVRLTTLGVRGGPAAMLVQHRLFTTRGFLAPEVREAMGLPWSEADQRRFERTLRRAARVEHLLGRAGRDLPFRLMLADMRRRRRRGRPLV